MEVDKHRSQLDLLRDLAQVPRVFVMGGVAEDALLRRELSPGRQDIDLLLEASVASEVIDALAQAGLAPFEPVVVGPAGEALAWVCHSRALAVEVWSCARTSDGFAIVLPNAGAGYVRLSLPADTFDHPGTALEGVAVRTISPWALSLFRSASALTRGSPDKRIEDRETAEQIRRVFRLEHPSEDLRPRISPA